MNHIQHCTIGDLESLRNLSIQCFSETFGTENDQDDLKAYIENAFSFEQLTTCLNNPASDYYFFLENNMPIGYLKINEAPAQTELNDISAIEIERIYVLKGHHGAAAGRSLMEHAIKTAISRNKRYLFLGVWENNHRAIRFYEKHGFKVFDTHIFTIGTSQQTDYIMKKEL